MKKFFLVGASVFALGMGSAMAGNISDVDQANESNTATVNQNHDGVGNENRSTVEQYGQRGSAIIEQVGSGNTSSALQSADARNGVMTVYQKGVDNESSIEQASVRQQSAHTIRPTASVDQRGDENDAVITQGTAVVVTRVQATIEQVGNNNDGSIFQSVQAGSASQTGPFASIFQGGDDNIAVTTQYATGGIGAGLGSYNSSTTVQRGNGSDALVTQAGGRNTSGVTQDVDGGGTGHEATVTQFGSAHDSIVNQAGSDHTALVSQTGLGHFSDVSQAGIGHMATVTQAGLGHISNVNQAGIGQSATVTQN